MNKFLSTLLASTMLLSSLGTSLAVETAETVQTTEVEIHTDTLTSGACGENATWSFDSATGTLTISGTGPLDDYAPWFAHWDAIDFLVISEGITTIGEFTFNSCSNITSVTIPDSVTSIGYSAFFQCTSLISVAIPNSVTEISYGAFYDCKSLTSVIIPDSVTTIGRLAFAGCYALASVTITNTVTEISNGVFSGCNALTTVYYGGSEADRGEMMIDSYNDPLEDATWIYNSDISNTAPSTPEVTPEPDSTPEPDAVAKTATPSTAKVMVNGEEVNFGAYNIDGYNYFKLTDMSYALNGTAKQFLVSWDAEKNAINMISGESHNELGTELQGNSGQNEVADEFLSPVLLDGTPVSVVAYIIDGSSYFQLDTLKEIVGISVGWDNDTSTITITA